MIPSGTTMDSPRLKPFTIERWMDVYEPTAKHNIAESCASSISISDLLSLAPSGSTGIFSINRKLTYGEIRGSDQLRSNLAALYAKFEGPLLPKENILVTNGAIGANFAILYTLIREGDHVICQYPTYQQLYSVPTSLGAKVDFWRADPENGWQLDVEELKKTIRKDTRLIILK
jgi:aspartate/methionine/tyrosine aminotransferase